MPPGDGTVAAAMGSWRNLAEVSPGDRTDAWQRMLSDSYREWQVPRRLPTDFQARLRSRDIAGSGLVECVCDPCEGRRTLHQLRRDGDRYVGVQLTTAGRERFNTTEGSLEVARGDLVVWTTDSAVDFEVLERLHKVTLMVPWSSLRHHLPERQRLPSSGRMDGRFGVGALLASHLLALASQIDVLDAGLHRSINGWTLDLLGAALAGRQPIGRCEGGIAMLRQVQMHVLEHLHDSDLTPSRIAATHRMSLRHLHLLFQRNDLTVSGWIQEQRLQRCRDALLATTCRRLLISEIAYRWGFVSAPHFSRAFKQRFGLSPRELRTSMSPPAAADAGSG